MALFDFEDGRLPSGWEQPAGSAAPWAIDTAQAHSGTRSLRSGVVGDSQASIVRVSVECVAGEIAFWYRVSSESGYDGLRFSIDGVSQLLDGRELASGYLDWALAQFSVAPGGHVFQWTYSKDGSSSIYDDAAWIDAVSIPVRPPSVAARIAMTFGAMARVAARLSAPFSAAAEVVAPTGAVAARLAAPFAVLSAAVAARLAAPFSAPARTAVAARLAAPFSAPDTSALVTTSAPRLLHAGRELSLCGTLEISADEGSPVWVCAPELALPEDYAAVQIGDALTLELGGSTWALVCDGRSYSDGEQGPSYKLSAISPVALLGAPWALDTSIAQPGMARDLVCALLDQSVDWQLPNWLVPLEALSAQGTPLELARTLVAAVGGLLESLPSGALVARPAYPVSPPDYPSAAASVLTDHVVLAHAEEADAVQRLNRYTITSGGDLEAAATPAIQIESEQVDGDPHRYTVRCYPYPLRAVGLVHTGDANTRIGPRAALAETRSELIEFQAGVGSASHPISALVGVTWQHVGLGALRFEGTQLAAASAGYSLARVDYVARGWEWEVADAVTETIQFLAEE